MIVGSKVYWVDIEVRDDGSVAAFPFVGKVTSISCSGAIRCTPTGGTERIVGNGTIRDTREGAKVAAVSQLKRMKARYVRGFNDSIKSLTPA